MGRKERADKAERQQQPMEFDVLQHHVKALDRLLHNMADIDDMLDELDEAAKKAGGDNYDVEAHRQDMRLQGAAAHPGRRDATARRH